MKKIFLVLFILFFLVTSCALNSKIYTDNNEIFDTIINLQPKVILLNDIPLQAQPGNGYCGITSVAIMRNYFNNTDYKANDLIKKHNLTKGASNDDIKKWLQLEMPEKNIVFKSNVTNKDMISNIHASLDHGNPVLISFGAPNPYNKPLYDFHASVVYGINLNNETVTIANAYGYIEEISLVDFLNRMSFTEIDKYAFVQRITLKMNRMDKNSYFLIN